MYTVATLEVDLSVVPKDEFVVMRSPAGQPYYRLMFEVEIAVQSSLHYSLLVSGKKYASVTATYK